MRICRSRAMRGPNLWCRRPVLVVEFDLEGHEEWRSGERESFVEKLVDRIPEPRIFDPAREEVLSRVDHLRSERLRLQSVLEHVTRILQGLTGGRPGEAWTEPADSSGRFQLVVPFDDEPVEGNCLELAVHLIQTVLDGGTPDVAHEVGGLKFRSNEGRLGPSSRGLLVEVEARGIPWRRLNTGSLVQLGWGRLQRRIWTAQTDRTTVIASDIAADKELTRSLLRAAGLPVPAGRVVSSAADAWAATEELGVPVVVKPRDFNHAQGVSIGLTTREQVEHAYGIAVNPRKDHLRFEVIVERYVPGAEHRLLVVDGRMVAAYRGEPPHVLGDGRRTVAELAEALNADPRRGPEWHAPLDRVPVDDVALLVLGDQGLTPESIPEPSRRVNLQRWADECTDVTEQVHPDVAARAVEAAEMVGLDLAGIDLLADDIGRPLEEQGGAIVEVNSGPGLANHFQPTHGRPQPVARAILDSLFPPGANGRIPVVALVGRSGGAVGLARRLQRRLRAEGRVVGLSTVEGSELGERRLGTCQGAPADAARELLLHPRLEILLAQVDPHGVREEGLGFDECVVAVFVEATPADVSNVILGCVGRNGIVFVAPSAGSSVDECPATISRIRDEEDDEPILAAIRKAAVEMLDSRRARRAD